MQISLHCFAFLQIKLLGFLFHELFLVLDLRLQFLDGSHVLLDDWGDFLQLILECLQFRRVCLLFGGILFVGVLVAFIFDQGLYFGFKGLQLHSARQELTLELTHLALQLLFLCWIILCIHELYLLGHLFLGQLYCRLQFQHLVIYGIHLARAGG